MNFLKKAGEALAPGINVRNESEVPVLFVLSQLSPLHWVKVEPGETQHVKCGRVWFTISTDEYEEEEEPSKAGVAARIAAITTVTVLTGGLLGLGFVGTVSALTSSKGTKMDGVFADGKTVVIGKRDESNKLKFTALEPAP
jgi:hypothetical protein